MKAYQWSSQLAAFYLIAFSKKFLDWSKFSMLSSILQFYVLYYQQLRLQPKHTLKVLLQKYVQTVLQ